MFTRGPQARGLGQRKHTVEVQAELRIWHWGGGSEGPFLTVGGPGWFGHAKFMVPEGTSDLGSDLKVING